VMGFTIVMFRVFHLDTIINTICTIAGYTYGPLLGLFAFGLFTKLKPVDWTVPIFAVIAPLLTGIVDYYAVDIFGAPMGYEKLLLNGGLMFGLLCLASINQDKIEVKELYN
jgi:hypothetical protein